MKPERKRHPLAIPDEASRTRANASRDLIPMCAQVTVYTSCDHQVYGVGEFFGRVSKITSDSNTVLLSTDFADPNVILFNLNREKHIPLGIAAACTVSKIQLHSGEVLYDDELDSEGRLKYYWLVTE